MSMHGRGRRRRARRQRRRAAGGAGEPRRGGDGPQHVRPGPRPWPDEEWKGWWGDDPPFHCPVYVLTHHPRDPFELENGNSFHFVTEGIEKAIAEAKEAADDQDVSVGGGASTLQQAIAAGLLDEIVVTQVPILLGGGERLFDHLAAGAARSSWPPWSRAPKRSTSPTASAEHEFLKRAL